MASEQRRDFAAPTREELKNRITARGRVPRHLAVIMDGNGRWAAARRLPRVAGHRAGRHAVRRCLRACGEIGVSYLTLYTFSQENWKRPSTEVKALWRFLDETLAGERDELDRNNVRLIITGETDQVPGPVRRVLDDAVAALADNDGLVLNLALSYGGRTEILSAARALAVSAAVGELDPGDIDEELFRSHLYAPEVPDPDLVIRTSGEQRLSNFLIWQSAYAELHITPVLWPDFCERDLFLAVDDYQGRERRFGGVGGGEDAGRDGEGQERGSLLDPKRWRRLLKGRS